MAQTSYVYILWLVILAAGLWIILSFGSLLHAREDLAGEWELTPEKPSAGEKQVAMHIDQSGRYLNLTLAGSKPLSVKMVDERVVDAQLGQHKCIVLRGDGSTATFEGRVGGDLWRVALGGNLHGEYLAHLTDRTYPRPQPAVLQNSAKTSDAR